MSEARFDDKNITELIVDGKNVLRPIDLEKNKLEINRQRDNVPSDVSLNGFKETVGPFPNLVTGAKANDLVEQIQVCFTDTNKRLENIYDELKTIFGTVESIHGGSIKGIIIAIKAAQNAITQSEYAIGEIEDTLEILQGFKERLEENTKHLNDIDIIWDNTRKLEKSCVLITEELNERYSKLSEDIKVLKRFKAEIEQYKHIKNIDEIFQDIKNLNSELKKTKKKYSEELKHLADNLKSTADNQQSDIKILLDFMNVLSGYEHLKDIDIIWHSNDVHSKKLYEMEKQSEKIKNIIQTNKELSDTAIEGVVENNNVAMGLLNKKIKYTNLIAYSSLGVALIELIIILLKVI